MEQRKLIILIIDDNLADIEIFRRCIEDIEGWDSTVLAFTNASAALEEIKRGEVDMLFIDYLLGGVTGYELFLQIRELGCQKPVIMLTGHGNEAIAVDVMKAGASDYLIKGQISSHNLRRAISNALEKDALHRKIEEQQKALIDAERTSVMIQSVGAACHHLSQPLTAIYGNLELLLSRSCKPEDRALIENCLKASDRMTEILKKLRDLQEYKTVPYARNFDILDIGIEMGKGVDKD